MRNVVFTRNNPSNDDIVALLGNPEFSYIVFGEEVGAQGTPHLQGYAEFGGPRSFNTVRRSLLVGTHIERRRGSQEEAIRYCKKDGNWQEAGAPSVQGQRSDLISMQKNIRDGMSDLHLFESYPVPMFRFHRAFAKYRSLLASPRDRQVAADVRFYHGASGTGKTLAAWNEFPNLSVHLGGKWFDGFVDGSAFLFDDLDDSVFTIGYLLQLLDRYPMRVQVKGGSVEWNPSVIVITSNATLGDWYAFESDNSRLALRRRFSEIRPF